MSYLIYIIINKYKLIIFKSLKNIYSTIIIIFNCCKRDGGCSIILLGKFSRLGYLVNSPSQS